MLNKSKNTTHFGYQTVDKEEKTNLVGNVFHSVASKYDLMNDIMSLGIHRIWKRLTIQYSGVKPGHYVLDLAGGTGDLTAHFSNLVGKNGLVILADINNSMLEEGRKKLRNKGILRNVRYIQANAENLPFPDKAFDCITIAFGLRNVTASNQALTSMFRVLKIGGRLIILEFSKLESALLNKIYNIYSFQVLPFLGKLIAQDSHSYRYLAESIHVHPDQETLKRIMIDVGFRETSYKNLTGGIVALHRGFKF
ncbi:bifunctional demethylmenaquinone methyltransferase/2-methoxy-6-polyprenyl-1,4-benzoquinol methylase UbiE [Candidatus Erwinia haradaeae]|uniref:Ubiquinone/menaquinone biosynthesis C-methyltransferase UbiE n=1 Tax=Candidatus Erwinia haradaeae TaxID=1922217 RepID=A0A451DIH0_9GAMM|nr:bifunctional demethylmenaquinone methyltransferase/2-methoxy-6-polyprenyl-1,4-benzoquinol methylase UbiE [Candidatus Erwinia haradaeae]VFP86472.1 Ubiquinone/menaquinone biosynthesis C-methyltransferase UbiE [Candidatus Erwinia haradaeae]